tara:strand:+ start:850 stop:1059 length:210 start_codon:yes stop_codon:yes gene_type:complete
MKTTILIAIALVLFSSNQDQSKSDNYEVINTLEDMKEWMDWDVINGDLDSDKANIYKDNINRCITKLNR